jgi:hypothetical protein
MTFSVSYLLSPPRELKTGMVLSNGMLDREALTHVQPSAANNSGWMPSLRALSTRVPAAEVRWR